MRLLTGITLLIVLAACSPQSEPPDDGPSQTPNGSPADQPTLRQSREQVRTTTQDVLELMVSDKGPLAVAKPALAFANGAWTACTDDLVAWAYDGSGRVDLGSGESAVDLLEAVRRAVESQGWVYDPHPAAADPETSVTARKGPHLLRVRAYDGQPFVLIEVSGPCLEASSAQQADLGSHRKSEPIELP
ncbi:MAG: hypothetical protein WKF76_01725 [Nocardioidaceae bacterium]